ncbi:MAG: ArsR family transcriptional regulator [Phycisphaerales bacterium]|nr:ArsR family transcriptional regulator [Phycisphaerales bacterium]
MPRPARTNSQSPVVELLGQLGDPIRLRMLRVLEREELAVGELVRVLQIPQSSGSRHLKVLLDGEWVFKRTSGPSAYYRVVLDDLRADQRGIWVPIRDQLGADPEYAEDDRRLKSVLAERMTDSDSFFGKHAGEWDDLRSNLFGQRFTDQAMLGLIDPFWTIADLGCGTGNCSELLCPWVKKVIAVDASEAMLDAARDRIPDRSNIEFVLGDLTKLPLKKGSVDAVACFLVLHHLDDPGAALSEMARVVSDKHGGGYALIVDMFAHNRNEYKHTMGHQHLGFTESQISKLLKDSGFRSVRINKLRPGVDASGPSLFAAVARI